MYIPKHFEEPKLEVMYGLISECPLATLVTSTQNGLNANHIPMLLFEDGSEYGALQCHVARANPIWKEGSDGSEALAIFHGSEAYISPNWYATKSETGKVVPTWDYAVVHAYGTLKVMDDAVWVRSLIERLTTKQESSYETPWKLTDAPEGYIEKLITAVVGIEIKITKLEGKWKVSQNQSLQNKESVISGLKERGKPDDLKMAELVGRNLDQ